MQKLLLPKIDLNFIVTYGPGYVYWKNLKSVYIGCNQNFATLIGLVKPEDIIGIHESGMPWAKNLPNTVAHNINADQQVISTMQKVITEECLGIMNENGLPIILRSEKLPLIDKEGVLVGILGVSVDITTQKEAEQLRIKTEKHKIYVEEQEKFIKIVGQMAHDIRSPLSTLRTLAQTAEELSEQKRITLRRAVIGVEDITNHMLNRYKPQAPALTENNQRQYVLVSAILSEIASERRYRYQDTLIEFEFIINKPQVDNFVFIQIEPSNLRRMLSNLINNAVESLPESGGKVMLILISSREWVEIIVEDNGKGISRQILDKIRQKNSITEGKAGGFGIGLTQVFDVVESNYGKFQIYSNDTMPDRGTIVRVRFPKATAQQWLATEIKITSNDTIIIVDDDISIHDAWDSRFARIVEKTPTIQIKHFMSGSEALLFINEIPDKQNFCLLSDYELVKQDLNGLEIIQESGIQRSILVTSHYANLEVKKLADQMAVKILPKDLVYSITIDIEQLQHKPGELVNVHMVIVDDEIESVKRLITDHYAHLIVDVYHNPFEFLKQVDKYPKNTKIIMDNKYYYNGNELIRDINGAIMASQLYVKGYTNLYIYSWEKCDTPEHVTLILKTDIETMAHLDEL